uniref:Ribonuclease P family protein n=1 Tax=Solanum tuberosum TaxID=4113 RepID=M0ZYL3_SOLTU
MVDETMSEQQKKRTMEALERRFTQAKAEIHQQQHKNKKIGVTTKTLAENNIGLTSQRINCLHCSNQRHLPQLRHPKKVPSFIFSSLFHLFLIYINQLCWRS